MRPLDAEDLQREFDALREEVDRALRRGARRRETPRYLTGGVIAALALAAAVVVAVALTSPRPVPPPVGQTSPVVSASSSASPTDSSALAAQLDSAQAVAAGPGADSGTAWAVTGGGSPAIKTSLDGGASWVSHPLPGTLDGATFVSSVGGSYARSAVSVSAKFVVAAMATKANEVVVATAPAADGSAAAWSVRTVMLPWSGDAAKLAASDGGTPWIFLTQTSGDHIVLVAQGFGGSMNSGYTMTFVSDDGGKTFVGAGDTPTNLLQQVIFLNDRIGVASAGAVPFMLELTTDGGKHWTDHYFPQADPTGENTVGNVVQVDQMTVDDGAIAIPVIKDAGGGKYSLQVYTTGDAVNLLKQAPELTDLTEQDIANTGVSVRGGEVRFAASRAVRVATAASVRSYDSEVGSLAGPVTQLAFSSSTDGLLVGTLPCKTVGSCPSVVLRTTDGGSSWQSAMPGASSTSQPSGGASAFASGFNGQYGWRVISDSPVNSPMSVPGLFQVTSDGGTTWADDALPKDVFPGDVGNAYTVEVSSAGLLAMTAATTQKVMLYSQGLSAGRLGTGTWLGGATFPHFDEGTAKAFAQEGLDAPTDIVGASTPDGSTIHFLIQFSMNKEQTATWLATATARMTAVPVQVTAPFYVSALAFADADHAVAISHVETGDDLLVSVSSDGGATWSTTADAVTPGLPKSGEFIWAGVRDGGYLLARREDGDGGPTGIRFYTLSLAGALQPVGQPLAFEPDIRIGTEVAVSGDTFFVWSGYAQTNTKTSSGTTEVGSAGMLYRSGDAGQTWDTVGRQAPPYGVAATSATDLIGVEGRCSPLAVGCGLGAILGSMVRTTDGGKTWRPVA